MWTCPVSYVHPLKSHMTVRLVQTRCPILLPYPRCYDTWHNSLAIHKGRGGKNTSASSTRRLEGQNAGWQSYRTGWRCLSSAYYHMTVYTYLRCPILLHCFTHHVFILNTQQKTWNPTRNVELMSLGQFRNNLNLLISPLTFTLIMTKEMKVFGLMLAASCS